MYIHVCAYGYLPPYLWQTRLAIKNYKKKPKVQYNSTILSLQSFVGWFVWLCWLCLQISTNSFCKKQQLHADKRQMVTERYQK